MVELFYSHDELADKGYVKVSFNKGAAQLVYEQTDFLKYIKENNISHYERTTYENILEPNLEYGKMHCGIVFEFETEKEAVMFKMLWG